MKDTSYLKVFLPTLLLCLAVVVAACQEPEADPAEGEAATTEKASPEANVVEIMGLDFAFSAPRELPSGWTTFQFVNRGEEAHHVSVVRLEDGKTPKDLLEAFGSTEPVPESFVAVGGANGVAPGGAANATVHLQPGSYVLACFIPSPDGVPHLAKGMVWPLTVTEEASGAPEPDVDVEMELTDYDFKLSQEVAPGEQTIRVTNAAEDRPHEVVLARLQPGKDVEAVIEWMHAMEGPPPAEFLGGATALSPGKSSTFTTEFEPGEYAWICPLIEHKGAQSHTDHGMYRQFTVN